MVIQHYAKLAAGNAFLKKAIFYAPVCLILSACGLLSPFKSDHAARIQETFDDSREAILVFGLTNKHARVQLEAGAIDEDAQYRADWTNLYPIFYGAADKGFVLVKVPANRPIAITSVSMESSWKQFWSGGPFQTCKGQKVAVFQVPRGQVLYYADFDFHSDGSALFFSAQDNLAGAQDYVSSRFPALAGRLQAANFSSLTRGDDCQKMPSTSTKTAIR